MAEATEIVSTAEKFHNSVHPEEKIPGLPSSLPDCVDRVRSGELVHCSPDKPKDKACRAQRKTCPSVPSLPEQVGEKKFKSKSKMQKTDCSFLSYLQLVMDLNAQEGNHSIGRLNSNGRYRSPVLSSSGHTIREPKINPGKIPSLLDIVIPMVHADSLKLYPCTSQLRQQRETFYSGLYTSDFLIENSDVLKTDPRKIPSLLDIVLPTVHADSFMMNSCERQQKPKQGNCSSVLRASEHRNLPKKVAKRNPGKTPLLFDIVKPAKNPDSFKLNTCSRQPTPNCRSSSCQRNEEIPASESNQGTIPSLLDIVIPVVHADSLKLNTCTRKLATKRGNWNHRNENIPASTSNPGKIPSLFDIVIPVEHADSFKLNICPRKPAPKHGNCRSSSNHRNEKMPTSTSNPGKIPSLLDIVVPMKQANSLKLSTCVRQYKPTRGHSPTASRKSEKRNQKIAASKSNTGQIQLLCHPGTSSSHTHTFKLNPEAREYQPKQRNVNGAEMGDARHNDVCPLSQNLNNQGRTLCANTDQNIALCSASVQCEPVTGSGQDSNAIPATDIMMVEKNEQKLRSVINGPLENGNTEAKPEILSPLQQSELIHEQTPRRRRMARFLGPIPFRSYMYIVDTNNHHDTTANNDDRFQHGGELPLASKNDASFPDRMSVTESEEGPVTPEPYKSRHESFVWKWPEFPVPRSQTMDGAGEDETGAQIDSLPELEMTVFDFIEMIEETYKEPIIEGIDAFVNVQQGVINRIATDNHGMSLTTDQTVHPSCRTHPSLTDATGQSVGVSRFRQ